MAVDLTGGLSDELEYVFGEQPDDREMRESVNVWVWNDGIDFGIPRLGIEAIADQWDTHDLQVNIAVADGRVFGLFEPGKVHDPFGADGRPRILGAGPLSFELIEPFHRWRVRFDGWAVAGSTEALIQRMSSQGSASSRPPVGRWTAGAPESSRVPVRLEMDIEHTVPPWANGALLEEAQRVLDTQEEGDLIGGPRFEQLFRATGSLRVGDEIHPLHGGGLRIRRQGIRRMARFWGHTWQSALFPSGRGFGSQAYPPRADGKPTYNEAFLYEGDGPLIPARVVEAPWLRVVQGKGEDVSVVVETDRGHTTIHGESLFSAFHTLTADSGPSLVLQQAIIRYTWDGETANGMLERSMTYDQVTRP